ncbi:MAG: type III pantothenate kinase [Nitrospirota bacterium]
MFLIAVDIGNSLINIGFFVEQHLSVHKIEASPLKIREEYETILKKLLENLGEKNITGVIISSVAPGHTIVLKEALKSMTSVDPLIVSWRMKTGLSFAIPHPEKLGSDRIANAAAAYELFRRPVAAIDTGTASTISIVGEKATFVGGAILPGLRLMNESLARGTAQLSEVPLSPPVSALGTDTAGCIKAGLFYGTAGAIERILDEIEKKIGYRVKVVVTGGYGGMISKFLKRQNKIMPHLTLEGLKILYMRNRDA